MKARVHWSVGLQKVAAMPSDMHVTDASAQTDLEFSLDVVSCFLYASRVFSGEMNG